MNFLYGDQDGKLDEDIDDDDAESAGTLFQADLTTGWNVSEHFYIGANASIQTIGEGEEIVNGRVQDDGADNHSFFGVALYPKFTLSESFALGLRAEYFAVTNGHLGIIGLDDSGDGNVMEFTLSGKLQSRWSYFYP